MRFFFDLLFFLYDCARFGAALALIGAESLPLITANAFFPALGAVVLLRGNRRGAESFYALLKTLFVFSFFLHIIFNGMPNFLDSASFKISVFCAVIVVPDIISIVYYLLSAKKRVEKVDKVEKTETRAAEIGEI